MAFQLDHNIFFNALGAQQQKQKSFFDQLAQGIQAGQNAQAMDIEKRQYEAKQEAEKYDIKNMAERGAYEMARTGQTSPENQAAIKAWQSMQRPVFDPTTGEMMGAPDILKTLGGVQGGTGASQGGGIYEKLTGQTAPAPQTAWGMVAPVSPAQLDAPVPNVPVPGGRLSVADLQSTGDPEMDARRAQMYAQNAAAQGNEDDFMGASNSPPSVLRTRPSPQLPAPQNPKQVQDNYGAQLDIAKDAAKQDYAAQITSAKEEIKTEQGRGKVLQILSRMNELNDGLQRTGGIVSEDQSIADRIGTTIKAASPRLRRVLSPEQQKLADEYEKLQSSLLPYYASASGLTAKSLDSDGERKAILGSFGDPYQTYESNKNQLNNLMGLFGLDAQNQAPSQDLNYFRSKYGLE